MLGTDRLGRDIYSRLLYGGRRLVTIAVDGGHAGAAGGRAVSVCWPAIGAALSDTVAMRIVDGLLTFPGLLLYLLFVTLAQAWKFEGVMIDARAGGGAFPGLRAGSGTALARLQCWRRSKRNMSKPPARWAIRSRSRSAEILPNIISPLIVTAHSAAGFVILIVAALSFLGLGDTTADAGLGLRSQRCARLHGERIP